MSGPENSSSRPDYEQAKSRLIVPPVHKEEADDMDKEVVWDKPSPSGPPNPVLMQTPPDLKELIEWFNSIIDDEALLMDLCLQKAVAVVERVHNSGMVGIDYFTEGQNGGMAPTRTNIVAITIPMAVEFYKQVLAGVNARAPEFLAIINRIHKGRQACAAEKAPGTSDTPA